MSDQAMVVHGGGGQVAHADAFMPVMHIKQAVQRYNAVLQFTQEIMKPGKDYGTIPGVEKPSLLKPGAEKLCSFFGLSPKFIQVKVSEEWTGDEPFFYFTYKCQLFRGDVLIAEGDGSCNSRESKYRYRWVNEDQIPAHLNKKSLVSRGGRISEFDFAIDKAETTGKYGKPASYWQQFKDAIAAGTATRVQKKMKDTTRPGWEIDSTVYRVPNPDVADQVNTIQKMAQKRALIAAVLIACNASEYYTQDIEDMDVIDVPYSPAPQHQGSAAMAQAVANEKLDGARHGKTYTEMSSPDPRVERNQPPDPPTPFDDPAPPPAAAQPAPPAKLEGVTLDGLLMGTRNFKGCVEAIETCKVLLADEPRYRQVLGNYGMTKANEFGTLGNARAAIKALWEEYTATAAPQGFQGTDEDLPEEMLPSGHPTQYDEGGRR